MKAIIIKTIIPTILGIISVLGILILISLIFDKGAVFTTPDNGFFKIFVPIATIIAMLIQLLIALPVWNKFKNTKKFVGLPIFPFTALICFISGLLFGYVFWEPVAGYIELVMLCLTGIIAFAIYWSVNLLSLQKIEKTLKKKKNKYD